ncbi:MAG: nucleoside hydrolase [Pirellulaceae bacterium]
MHSRTTKTLVPLDVTLRQIPFYLDLMDTIPDSTSRLGRLLRQMLPFAFRAYRQRMGQEGIFLNDVIALLAFLEPDLFEAESMAMDVEVSGDLSRGMTLFDRRPHPEWRPNAEVVRSVNEPLLRERIQLRLRKAGVLFAD